MWLLFSHIDTKLSIFSCWHFSTCERHLSGIILVLFSFTSYFCSCFLARSWICNFDHIHLLGRRVHVIVVGDISFESWRMVHQADALCSSYLQCFKANQCCHISRSDFCLSASLSSFATLMDGWMHN